MAVQAVDGLHYLFGGSQPWEFSTWVASDDTVRGGKSHSYLDPVPGQPGHACFHGNLDAHTLGGAGFASRRTGDSFSWDLSQFAGLAVNMAKGDGKKYTLNLKDQILPPSPDGREQSTISWEYDFIGQAGQQLIQWHDFNATYRGRPKPDADPLNLSDIKRMSIMMRSFFGEQDGDFDLELVYIAATPSCADETSSQGEAKAGAAPAKARAAEANSWFSWASGLFKNVL